MEPLDLAKVRDYVSGRIEVFRQQHAQSTQGLRLQELMRQNPYLYRARHFRTAATLIDSLLEDYFSASEERVFGRLLVDLVVFVAQQACHGYRSKAEGVDVEFVNQGVHHLVCVKPGHRPRNSAENDQLERNLKTAVARMRQLPAATSVLPVLGVCYGRMSPSRERSYLEVAGQDFWYLVSENRELYKEVVEPLRYCTKEVGQELANERPFLVNRLMTEFFTEFCEESGAIHWPRLVDYIDRVHA